MGFFFSLNTMLFYYNLFILADTSSKEDLYWRAVTVLFFTALFAITVIQHRKKKEIKFNRANTFDEENVIEALIILSAQMLKSDRGFSKEKLRFMHQYFHDRFPETYVNFREILSEAYKTPINLDSISLWFKQNNFSHEYHLNIIYFLSGLCIIDGRFSQSEIKSLKQLAFHLKVTEQEIESVIAMYQAHEDEKRRKEWREKSASRIKSPNQKDLAYKILGLNKSATPKEIKDAYRKLAKLHHPDKFYNESQEIQKIAEEKFITIQKAYDALK